MKKNLYEKAVAFAARAHAGQTRKGDGTPYIVHPFIVASMLREQGCSINAIIAGLLHDTVEDTNVSIHDIENEFSGDIAAIVAECTEPEKAMLWEERKQHSIEVIKTASLDAKYVTCADKLHNLRSLIAAHEELGPEVWSRFSRGYEGQKWYAESMLSSIFFGLDDTAIKPMLKFHKKLIKEFYNR
jgi:(p)ppGpp synthase/HD superfamily hydrolase